MHGQQNIKILRYVSMYLRHLQEDVSYVAKVTK